MKSAILLIDHGSRRPEAHRQLVNVASRLSSRLKEQGRSAIVEIAHLEIESPTIAEGFSACVQAGAEHVFALPCFLSRGRHVAEDIPALLLQAAAKHAHVTHAVAAPLSEHDGFIELLCAASLEEES